MEKQKTNLVLCGGTFFLLVLDALKIRTGVRERIKGGSDGLSDPNVFVGLYKIINPEVSESISSSISSFVSNYKYCKQSTTPKINLEDDDVIEAFNRRVTEKYSSALKQAEEFVARFLCTIYGHLPICKNFFHKFDKLECFHISELLVINV